MSEQHGSTSFSPGTVLAGTPHRIRREIGSGGVGTVYETYRLDTGERRAVKVLSSHVACDPALEERLLHEAEVLSVICSPHIIRVRGGGRLATGEAFYEMDLLEGETLRETLGRGPLEPSLACGLILQTLSALHAIHLAGLVHRDVKPENLFLCADGRCVLLDFGAAKVLTEAGRFSPRRFPTDKGKTFGTARYLPPEAGWFTPDARADIFATAVVFIEMIAGALELAHFDDGEYLEWVDACGVPVPDDFPEVFRPLVERATARSPDERHPSAAAFADALTRACREAGIEPVGVRPWAWAPRPAPRRVALRDLRPGPPPRHAAPARKPPGEPGPPSPASPAAPVRSRSLRRATLASAVTLGIAGVAACAAASLTVRSWASTPVAVRVAPEPRQAAPAGVVTPTERPAAPEPPPREAPPSDVPPNAPASPEEPPPPPAPPAVPSGAPEPSARGDRRARLEAKVRSGRATTQDAETLIALCRTRGDAPCVSLARLFLERYGGTR
jgi:eukaryotic-like serine/threonine-protein kinase